MLVSGGKVGSLKLEYFYPATRKPNLLMLRARSEITLPLFLLSSLSGGSFKHQIVKVIS